MTVRDLVTRSMRLAGILAAGETPSGTEASQALDSLNGIIESWAGDGLLSFVISRSNYSITGGSSSFTIDANSPLISSATVLVNSVEEPMKLINVDQYADIKLKTLQSTIPNVLYVESSATADTATGYVYPVPSSTTTIYLYLREGLPSSFASLATTVTLPSGYSRALIYELASELALEYGVQPNPLMLQTKDDLIADLKRANTQPVLSKSDVSGLVQKKNLFNIYTGE